MQWKAETDNKQKEIDFHDLSSKTPGATIVEHSILLRPLEGLPSCSPRWAREGSRRISRNSGTQNYFAFLFLEILILRFVSFLESTLSKLSKKQECWVFYRNGELLQEI